MTKRFTLDETTSDLIICDNGEPRFWVDEYDDIIEIIDLLNELHEENQHKQKLLHLSANKIENLLEENQQLKKLNIPIDEIKDTVSDYQGRIIGVYYND